MALATASGSAGDINYPLLISPDDWRRVSDRVPEFWEACDDLKRGELLSGLREAVGLAGREDAPSSVHRDQLTSLAHQVLSTARAAWDSAGAAIPLSLLRNFFDLSVLVEPLVPAPNLTPSWAEYWGAVAQISPKWTDVSDVAFGSLERWREFVALVENNEPRALRQVGFPEQQIPTLTAILRALQQIVGVKSEPTSKRDAEELVGSLDRCREVAEALNGFAQLETLADSVAGTADATKEWLEEFIKDNWPERDDDDDGDRRLEGEFDLQLFLEDL